MTKKRMTINEFSKDKTHFKIIKNGTLAFEAVTSVSRVRGAFGQPTTVLYDSIALRYNQCEPGDLFLMSLPNDPPLYNMRKHFKARGVAETDYRIFRPLCDETGAHFKPSKRPVAVQRLTSTRMIPLQPFPREAAALAKAAEERGVDAFLVQDENPVKPGPADEFPAGNENVVNT
jgi:hypothetical protein